MTLKLRLTLAIALSVFISLFINAFFSASISTNEMHDTLEAQFEKDLTSKRELIKSEIESYFKTIEGQIVALANNISTIDGTILFSQGFAQYQQQSEQQADSVVDTVDQYYQTQFAIEYQRQNNKFVTTSGLLNGLSDTALLMQYDFIANNANSLGNKDGLYEIGNGSDYDSIHAEYHESFRSFLQQFGFYDVFIVDVKTDNVIYSVFKELDFATNLTTGPYANSGLAEAYRNAKSLSKGQTYLTDFKAYLPSYDNPASFIATPIIEDGITIGVLVFQMPIEAINDVMTLHQQWREKGFGDSGEIYLVGEDKTLRNESRFLIEDKRGYIAALKSSGIENADLIDLKNTSIALQPANTPGVTKALRGETGFEIFNDYRQVPVLSAYAPVKVGHHTWAILSEIDEAEAFAPSYALAAKIWGYSVLVTGIMVFLSIAGAYLLALYLIRPLNTLQNQFEALNSNDADLTTRVPKSRIPEIDAISLGFNAFIEQIQDIILSVKQSSDLIASSSTELSATTEQTNVAAQSQLQDAENVSVAINQFNSSLQEVSDNSIIASESTENAKSSTEENAGRATSAAQNIGLLVQEVTTSAETLKQLQEEVSNINDVLNVINSIADQTNLLALNAAIEAARAGEHGRGFAVVADEVRQLASRTQESTVEIQNKIVQLTSVADAAVESMERASDSADGGIDLVRSVSESLQELNASIISLASINETVASATEEQKYTCESIGGNVEHVRESSLELSNASDQIANSAIGLAEIAANMQLQVGRFRTE